MHVGRSVHFLCSLECKSLYTLSMQYGTLLFNSKLGISFCPRQFEPSSHSWTHPFSASLASTLSLEPVDVNSVTTSRSDSPGQCSDWCSGKLWVLPWVGPGSVASSLQDKAMKKIQFMTGGYFIIGLGCGLSLADFTVLSFWVKNKPCGLCLLSICHRPKNFWVIGSRQVIAKTRLGHECALWGIPVNRRLRSGP